MYGRTHPNYKKTSFLIKKKPDRKIFECGFSIFPMTKWGKIVIKAVRAFLAGISLPESMAMAKASTSSDRSEGCGTEGDVVFEDLDFFYINNEKSKINLFFKQFLLKNPKKTKTLGVF